MKTLHFQTITHSTHVPIPQQIAPKTHYKFDKSIHSIHRKGITGEQAAADDPRSQTAYRFTGPNSSFIQEHV